MSMGSTFERLLPVDTTAVAVVTNKFQRHVHQIVFFQDVHVVLKNNVNYEKQLLNNNYGKQLQMLRQTN